MERSRCRTTGSMPVLALAAALTVAMGCTVGIRPVEPGPDLDASRASIDAATSDAVVDDDAVVPLDTGIDARIRSLDAGRDAPAYDAFVPVDEGVDAGPDTRPRLVAPLSTSRVTGTAPLAAGPTRPMPSTSRS